MLQVDVARLKRSPGETVSLNLKGEVPPLEQQGEKIFFAGPVVARLSITNTGKSLKVEGNVSGELKLTCSRCLEPFSYFFENPLEETYVPAAEMIAEEESVPFSGDILDITPEVQKSVFQLLPMKALCQEECPGLCLKCGKNLKEGPCNCAEDGVDSRLAVLKDLLKK